MLRSQARKRGPNPYSAVAYHQGYVYDKIRYTVLTASQMSTERAEMVTSTLKTITTGPQAMTLPEIPGWACTAVGMGSKVFIVSYLGIEVALFFKRQLTEIIPEPGEKIPEGVLQDPKEAWQRLDLLGRSAEKSNFVLTQTQRRLEESNKLLESRVKDLDDLNDALMKHQAFFGELKDVNEKNEELEKQIERANNRQASLAASKLKSRGKSKGLRGKAVLVDGKHRFASKMRPRSQSKRRVK